MTAESIAYDFDEMPIMEETAKMVNAHEFISQLLDGYMTQVGIKAFMRRIAIARQLCRIIRMTSRR